MSLNDETGTNANQNTDIAEKRQSETNAFQKYSIYDGACLHARAAESHEFHPRKATIFISPLSPSLDVYFKIVCTYGERLSQTRRIGRVVCRTVFNANRLNITCCIEC